MAKILISLLGTGQIEKNNTNKNEYKGTDYIIEETTYLDEKFVSSPLVKHYKIDKLFLVGTDQSMWDMVAESFKAEENYQFEIIEKKDNNTLREDSLIRLNEIIDKTLKNSGSKCFIVKDGENQEELWSIFEKFLEILDAIDEDDEVYFDITHLFRSLSVMSFVMSEFGKTYKNFKIAGVFYGMLKKGEPSVIVDLSIFFELLEWAKAIEELENFASLNRLVKLAKSSVDKNGYQSLKSLKAAFNIANMTAIYYAIQSLTKQLTHFDQSKNKIINLISPRLKRFIKRFDTNKQSDFQYELASFFAEKNFYSLAYIALAEAIVTDICERLKRDVNNKNDRDSIKSIINEGFNAGYDSSRYKFAVIFTKQINKIRNDIAHQRETTKNPQDDIKNFFKYFQKSKKYIKDIYI